MTRETALKLVYSSIRAMHLKNRSIHYAYGNEKLGLAESAVIQEILGNGNSLTATELGKSLGLSPVKISRLLRGAVEMGLVTRSLDGARLLISVTGYGKGIFSESYREARTVFAEAYDRVPVCDRQRFEETLETLCDGINAPFASSLDEDPPVMTFIRRLTRGCGFLSKNVFGSGRTPIDWHVINLISDDRVQSSCMGLSSQLGIFHTTMSTTLSRLEKEGLITRNISEIDARERKLSITAIGRIEIERIERYALKLLSRGLESIDSSNLEKFAQIFARYCDYHQSLNSLTLRDQVQLTRVSSSDLPRLRSFVMRERVEQNLLSSVPSSLLDEANPTFALQRGDELLAVFEFSTNERALAPKLVQGISTQSTSELSSEVLQEAYSEMVRMIVPESKLDLIASDLVDDSQISRQILKALSKR